MNIEHDLQRALRREPGPDDLADRVLARLASDAGVQPAPARRTLAPWLAAAAALVIAVGGAAGYYAEREERLASERARRQVLTALHIASETLARVQQRVETSLADRP